MPSQTHVVRDVSYAGSAETPAGQAVIRTLEALTGRGRLIRRAQGYADEVAAGRDFWQVMADRYGLTLQVDRGALRQIPREGPLIVVANHPYGILDGLVMGLILSRTRGDFRILANAVFRRAEDLNRFLLPVSFDPGREALATNLETRRAALQMLAQSGAIGIFPGGAVATSARPFSPVMDPGWRSFTARMVAKSRATVVPVFFEGHNRRLFQIASHLHQTLRLGLLIQEFGRRVDQPVRFGIGQPLGRDILDPLAGDAKTLMDFLRHKTYELSPEPVDSGSVGYQWD